MAVLSRLTARTPFFQGLLKSSLPRTKVASVSSFHSGAFRQDENKTVVNPTTPVEEVSFLEKTGLNDWKISVPIAAALAIPAISNGVYTLNEESQLACCFFLFVTSAYKLSSDMVASYFDARADAILREHNEIEDYNIALVKEALALHKANKGALQDIQLLNEAYEEYARLMTKIHASKLRHDVRATYIKNLEFIIEKESTFTAAAQQEMVKFAIKNATEDLKKGNKSILENSFSNALQILEGKDVESGKDEVKNLVTKYIKQYAADVSSRDGKTVKLSKEEVEQLQHELDVHVRSFNMQGAKMVVPTDVTLEIPK